MLNYVIFKTKIYLFFYANKYKTKIDQNLVECIIPDTSAKAFIRPRNEYPGL